MARPLHKLSASGLKGLLSRPGTYGDGGGLYLKVSSQWAASWLFRYSVDGEDIWMGLGSCADVPLVDARAQAAAARRLKSSGIAPLAERKRLAAEARLEAAKATTFKQAAEHYIAAHKASWANVKHAAQWGSTLTMYAYPTFGGLSVQAIDTALVTKAIEPIWSTKPETASRVRGRIESILDWAAARGLRTGENPARWRGHLENVLPGKGKVRRVAHHAALPYVEIATFMKALEQQPGEAARALRFAVLTAARTGEVLGALGGEIDRHKAVWTVPSGRMKAKREHRVPLSHEALALLPNELGGGPIFASPNKNGALSNMALLMVLRRMKRGDLTAHGFRSTFRDWAAEMTDYPAEMAEMALAHTVSNKVEAAYRRGDMFEKRRKMMQDWSDFCASTT